LDDVDNTLQTVAEIVGYLIHQLRSIGADQAEVLQDVELVVRAAEIDRQELRAARDVLRSLNYSPGLIKLLTALARKSKPKPPPWIERMRAAGLSRL
jgi:hypothetical protein